MPPSGLFDRSRQCRKDKKTPRGQNCLAFSGNHFFPRAILTKKTQVRQTDNRPTPLCSTVKKPEKGGGGGKTKATKPKVVSKAAPTGTKHLPVLEGFCLARGNLTMAVVCGVSGEPLPRCWRGGRCKAGSCEKSQLCPACRCECDFIPRPRKCKYITEDGGGGALAKGARKKEIKPVSNVTPSVIGISGRCSRARAPFQAHHCLFAFPSSQQGRSFYQSARNHRASGVCRPGQPDPGAPW
jgi:hypothetical protein